ncbi:MAG TPA: hypothetical protein VIV40_34010, partial [Kofleriaceae bacterium]
MSITVREAKPSDAAALIAHLKALAAEPGINIPLAGDEITMTVEQEKELLADIAESANAIMGSDPERIKAGLAQLLRERRHLADKDDDNFSVLDT